MVNAPDERADWRCPGTLHAAYAADGRLVRVRIPGGFITGEQCTALAAMSERYADGNIDITARASVQLRGITNEAVPALAQALAAAGLLPSADHDRVRNILASPFAGVDPAECADMRPFAHELDARLLADTALARLPAKFAFALDGGGRPFEHAGADVAAYARATTAGVRFDLAWGGRPAGYATTAEHLVDVLLGVARAALALAEARGIAAGGWRLAALPDAGAFIAAACDTRIFASPAPARSVRTQNVSDGVSDARDADRVNVVPAIRLGRIHARQARGIADLAGRHGADVRLAPWRGLVLANVPRRALADVRSVLAELDMRPDAADGYAGIAACAGRGACSASLADVRAHAAQLAQTLANEPRRADWSVNLAGCDKRCAMRRGATVELVATSDGYDVSVDSVLRASGVSVGNALDLARRAHASRSPETVA